MLHQSSSHQSHEAKAAKQSVSKKRKHRERHLRKDKRRGADKQPQTKRKPIKLVPRYQIDFDAGWKYILGKLLCRLLACKSQHDVCTYRRTNFCVDVVQRVLPAAAECGLGKIQGKLEARQRAMEERIEREKGEDALFACSIICKKRSR